MSAVPPSWEAFLAEWERDAMDPNAPWVDPGFRGEAPAEPHNHEQGYGPAPRNGPR